MIQAILLVMMGGAAGAAARYLVTQVSSNLSNQQGFALGTLAVNVLGSLVVGYVLTWSAGHSDDRWRLLAATGFCGGFTTFSAFAYETMMYWQDGKPYVAVLNVALNNALSLCAVVLGARLHSN